MIDRELLQSKTAKAIEHYEKFLDLWKDADPGIAEVEDAKKRVAKMKGRQLNDLRTFLSHISLSPLIQQLSQLAV